MSTISRENDGIKELIVKYYHAAIERENQGTNSQYSILAHVMLVSKKKKIGINKY